MGYRVVTVKRRLTKLVAFLLLGAVVNVAVAWGCACWSVGAELYDIYFDEYLPSQVKRYDERWLRANGWSTPQDESLTFGYLRAFGYFRVEYFSIPSAMFDPSKRRGGNGSYPAVVARTRSGWPLFGLRAEEWLDPLTYDRWRVGDSVRLSELYHYVGGIPVAIEVDIGGPIDLERVLPLRPIWTGFWPTPSTATGSRPMSSARASCARCSASRGRYIQPTSTRWRSTRSRSPPATPRRAMLM